MIRKGLAVAVILLFIGVAFAPSINANVVKDDFVELDVEFCGLNKKHLVQMNKREYNEVKLILTDFDNKISNAKSSEDGLDLIKNVLIELKPYNLFGNVELETIEDLIFGNYIISQFGEKIDRFTDYGTNLLCLIAGNVHGVFIDGLSWLLILFIDGFSGIFYPPIWLALIQLLLFISPIPNINPIPIATTVLVGEDSKIYSLGLLGLQFYDNIYNGIISGFSGIKISFPLSNRHYMIGVALYHDINEY